MKANLRLSRLWPIFLLLICLSFLACGEERSPAENDTPPESSSLSTSAIPSPPSIPVSQEVPVPAGFQKIDWDQLADVGFEVRFFEEAQDSLLFPKFGAEVKALEGQKIALAGYVIPVTYDRYVLSANPFSQCFFCGNAGPESVMELAIKDLDGVLFHTDEFRTFTGTLKLNDEDLDQLNYILEDAKAL